MPHAHLAPDADAYLDRIDAFAGALGDSDAAGVLEPDNIAHQFDSSTVRKVTRVPDSGTTGR